MARRNYRRRAYSGARRGYRGANKSYGKKMGFTFSPAFLAGVLIGFTDMDKKIPAQAVLGGATLPVRGLGPVKGGCQGIIFGNLIQQLKNGQITSSGYQGI